MYTSDQLREAVMAGMDIFREIKPNWNQLGFPGSVYSPNEFMVCLLLSYIGRDGQDLETLKEKIEAGKSARQNLVDCQALRSHMGSDELVIIFTTALASALNGSSQEPRREMPGPSPAASVAPPKPIRACPHCGHDFDKCQQGEYQAISSEVDKTAFAFQEEIPEEMRLPATEVSHEFCMHVDDYGKCLSCTEEETYECDGCSEDFIKPRGHKCKNPDCENVYCDNCTDNLNKAGYCSDCEEAECSDSSCGKSFPRENGVKCSGFDCQSDEVYCPECGQVRLNKDGLCSDCSGEEELDCSDCGCSVIESRAKKCRGKDCENVYCPSCAGNNLDSRDRCEDCR